MGRAIRFRCPQGVFEEVALYCWTTGKRALVAVGFRCGLDLRNYGLTGSYGSLPEEETQAPVIHSCAASITLRDHFWGVTFSAGAQRPSFSVITPGLESGVRNCRHRTNCDWASLPLKRSNKLIGNAACLIGGIKRPLPKFQNGVAMNILRHQCRHRCNVRRATPRRCQLCC